MVVCTATSDGLKRSGNRIIRPANRDERYNLVACSRVDTSYDVSQKSMAYYVASRSVKRIIIEHYSVSTRATDSQS